jgi:hypothetical protein
VENRDAFVEGGDVAQEGFIEAAGTEEGRVHEVGTRCCSEDIYTL